MSKYRSPGDDYDVEEDRFFLSGVEKVEQSRANYMFNAKKRKVLLGVAITVGVLAFLALVIGLAYGLRTRHVQYSCPSGFDSSKLDTVFFVVGDWGRQGSGSQMKAASVMSSIGACMTPKFVISTGDNFYDSGLKSANDSSFQKSFTNVYRHPSLQIPWYAVLGNHDYGDQLTQQQIENGVCKSNNIDVSQCVSQGCCYSPYWQVGAAGAAQDARWDCTQGVRKITVPAGSQSLDLILIDTNPLIPRYQQEPWAGLPNGILSQPRDSEYRLQIEQVLNSSTAPWKIVVGHHPVFSYGEHCKDPLNDCTEMYWLKALLQKYKVAAYMNGHDHDLQLIKKPDHDVRYVVSGAGSDVREWEFIGVDTPDALFKEDRHGFVAVTIQGDSLTLYFYVYGEGRAVFVHAITRPK